LWKPQEGPQHALIEALDAVFDVGYGGARGGGKTDGFIGDWLYHSRKYGAAATGIWIRREMPNQDDIIERAKQVLQPAGHTWRPGAREFVGPTGSRLRFRFLKNPEDFAKYQGFSFTRVYVEEMTQYADPAQIDKMLATLRSASGVPCGFRSNFNPGGPGHLWVKQRYVDTGDRVAVPCTTSWGESLEGHARLFIQAKVTDNRLLLANDPGYVDRLKLSGSEQLVAAWLYGLWDQIEGAFFDCWDARKHVVDPVYLPRHWTRFMAYDEGFATPFSVGWYAVSDGELSQFPRGALIRYREWYGWNGKPNVGMRMPAEDIARKIVEVDQLDEISYRVADPAIFAEKGGPSIAERMATATGGVCGFIRGDNARVPHGGAMGGWDQVRTRLIGVDGVSMLYVFSTNRNLIRTLPALQHDVHRPEDLDTDGEDHAADELRYACMSRPWIKHVADGQSEKAKRENTFEELMADQFRRDRREVRERI
jgi:hypothetical protein